MNIWYRVGKILEAETGRCVRRRGDKSVYHTTTKLIMMIIYITYNASSFIIQYIINKYVLHETVAHVSDYHLTKSRGESEKGRVLLYLYTFRPVSLSSLEMDPI